MLTALHEVNTEFAKLLLVVHSLVFFHSQKQYIASGHKEQFGNVT